MNRLKNIDYRLKQKLLYTDKTCPEILKKCGDLLREQGRISDALDFYQKADDREGLQKIKDMALESGDVMLFQQAAKGLGIELKPKDWEDIAQKAVQLKKHSFAQQALQKANHEKGLNAPKQH